MSFIPSHIDGQKMPRTIEKSTAAGSAFNDGALLLANASDEFAECAADPAVIGAVAASGAGADTTGFNRLGVKGFPPGKVQAHWVGDEQVFSAEYVGALPAAAGGSYGVIRDTDGRWKVDFNETVNTRVKLQSKKPTESPINRPRVLVTFLPANVQVLG
jgi:hypothetical protein